MTADTRPPQTASAPFDGPARSAQFEPTPLDPAILDALADVARWTGSSQQQPAVAVHRDHRAVDAPGHPRRRPARRRAASRPRRPRSRSSCRPIPPRAVHDAYDDGRVAERLLVAAAILDIGAGISWIRPDVRRGRRQHPRPAGRPDGPDDRPGRSPDRGGPGAEVAARRGPSAREARSCSRSAGRPADRERGRAPPRRPPARRRTAALPSAYTIRRSADRAPSYPPPR